MRSHEMWHEKKCQRWHFADVFIFLFHILFVFQLQRQRNHNFQTKIDFNVFWLLLARVWHIPKCHFVRICVLAKRRLRQ